MALHWPEEAVVFIIYDTRMSVGFSLFLHQYILHNSNNIFFQTHFLLLTVSPITFF